MIREACDREAKSLPCLDGLGMVKFISFNLHGNSILTNVSVFSISKNKVLPAWELNFDKSIGFCISKNNVVLAWELDFDGFLKKYKASSSLSFDGSGVKFVSNYILALHQRLLRANSKPTVIHRSLGQRQVKFLAIFRWRKHGLTDGSRSLR